MRSRRLPGSARRRGRIVSIGAGEVHAVSDLVGYQDRAVVSRQVMKLAAGSVTLFAFDEGEALSEHTTPHDALLHVLEGAVEVDIAGQARRLVAGDVVVLPAGVPHAVRAPERFKMALTMIRNSGDR